MTVVHTYFYIVVYTQRGCHTLRKNMVSILPVTLKSSTIPNYFLCIWSSSWQQDVRYKFCKYLTEVICLYDYCISFIILLINRHNDQLLPLLQSLIIPNRINKFMELITNCPASCFNHFCWNLINTGWFVTFCFSVPLFNLKGNWVRHKWLCCLYLILPNIINPKYMQQLREIFLRQQTKFEIILYCNFLSFEEFNFLNIQSS